MNLNIKSADIVVGCSFGDEGKGKVVFDLLKNNHYDLCVRFNGSGNAGHTIYHNSQKFVVHQLPIGVILPNVLNLISSNCLIDLPKLKIELEELSTLGITIHNRLFVSKACHVITQECIDFDKQNNKIGTTGSGIGPTYSQKMLRIGKRAEEFEKELLDLGIQLVDMRRFWYNNPNSIFHNIHNILFEGAQGFELDIDWTDHYPYCTSSTCTTAGAINTGFPFHKINKIFGVSKIYDTYVGLYEFQPKEYTNELNLIGDLGHEFGATTGRRRQCNYLNLDSLKEALLINQCNVCIINKIDILIELELFKLYHNHELITFSNWENMREFIQNELHFLQVIFSNNPFSI